TSPNALDDELAEQFGAPGDANDGVWTWIHQNTATATWTGGMISMTSPGHAGSEDINRLSAQVPGSTPYAYTTSLFANWLVGINARVGMCFFEQSSGKYWMWEIENLPSG